MKKNKLLVLGGIVTLILGVILILISPYILTYYSTGIYFKPQDSVIGEVVGGITAPISSLVGSILVFLALIAQVKANDTIQNQRREDRTIEELQNKYNYLNEEISRFQLFSKSNSHPYSNYSGIYAIFGYTDHLMDNYNSDSHNETFIKTNVNHSNVYNLLSLFLLTVEDTLDSKLKPDSKIYFIKLASHINASKLYPPFAVRLDQCQQADENNETHLICKKCNMYHPKVPGIIYERLVRIDISIRNALDLYEKTTKSS